MNILLRKNNPESIIKPLLALLEKMFEDIEITLYADADEIWWEDLKYDKLSDIFINIYGNNEYGSEVSFELFYNKKFIRTDGKTSHMAMENESFNLIFGEKCELTDGYNIDDVAMGKITTLLGYSDEELDLWLKMI